MTLSEMAREYRQSALVLRTRICVLRGRRNAAGDDGQRVLLEERIKLLETMWRETRDIAVLMERYYDRGYR
ncbi:MAG: hypothetical protein RRY53_08155, partial [Pseudoflavonifractor sp.]